MQETPVDPGVKAELARCFAAHRALMSLSVDIRVTSRGVPTLRNGVVQVALARPGRLRMEGFGALREVGTCLLVASNGFVYEASSPQKLYKSKSVPIDGDALTYGLASADMLPLLFFSRLMVEKDGLELLLQDYPKVQLTREALIGAPALRVFDFQKRDTRVQLRFDEKDCLLRQVLLIQGALEIRESYQNLRINPRLPETLWNFVPPRGFRDEDAPPPVLPPAPKLGARSVTTPTGLQYLDLKKGTGLPAKNGMTVVVHYTGYLTDGTKFDSSLEREPFTLKLPGPVILGWNEGLLGMCRGGKRKLVIPPSLGYGEAGAGGKIPPNATLIFEIEVLSVQGPTNG